MDNTVQTLSSLVRKFGQLNIFFLFLYNYIVNISTHLLCLSHYIEIQPPKSAILFSWGFNSWLIYKTVLTSKDIQSLKNTFNTV